PRHHSSCVHEYVCNFKLGATAMRTVVSPAKTRLLDLVFHYADHSPGVVIVRLGIITRSPDHRRDIKQRCAMKHVAAVCGGASFFEFGIDAIPSAHQLGE